jgi:hypothetical protein
MRLERMKKIVMLLMATALCGGTSFALDPEIQIAPHGFVYFQLGQFEQTFDGGNAVAIPDKTWDERFDIRLGFDAMIDQRMEVIADAELPFLIRQSPQANSSQVYGGLAPSQDLTGEDAVKEAQGIYTFGEDPKSKTPPLQVALGFFPFKYDASATNLGEYLFSTRTGTYPTYIISDFDNCQARLLGLRVSGWILNRIRLDMLLTSEQIFQPEGDLSLSFLAGYKLGSMLDCGVGVSCNRLIPVDPSLTNSPGDAPYTMQGVKLMARCAFDPKSLLSEGFSGAFGRQDLKIYSEAAILGVKNYGTYYDSVWQRMPIMLGFNFPTLNVLDVLSLEGEYFDYPYQNGIAGPDSPYPLPPSNFPNQNKRHWSIWAQKTIIKGFAITGLVGKDHFRWVEADGTSTPYDLLQANGNWHYNVRAMFSF